MKTLDLPLFNAAASRAEKKHGMDLAAYNALIPLALARRLARIIAMAGNGTCNADQVMEQFAKRGVVASGPWCGSIFKDGCWTFTGERVRSSRISNHAREIKVWRYRE